MLYFLFILGAGVALLVLAQMADIENVNPPVSRRPALKLSAFKPAKRKQYLAIRARLSQLAQLAQH